MPKVLTPAQVAAFETQGFLSPIRAMSAARARHYRERYEALEARCPNDIKKMKTKSHLLCPWVLEMAEDPHLLDIFEDLIGPDIRCWSMAWRVKKADGQTMAGWHQDSVYGSPIPVVLGAMALSSCGIRQGCLRGIPGSHRRGHLRHEESDDPRSILARGQYIADPFDESTAVDFVLEPGEMVLFHNSLIHGSAENAGPDRRFLLLIEMVPTWAERPRGRESAMLLRGVDTHDAFDDEPRPDGEFTEAALANWKRVVESRARRLFADSRYAPSEAYGGTRAAT
ncbi:MAG: phytanoyl-CoA dioxygenase family protein [Candidatus Rokubacteria bacterium]|nr:phytanoyl-CoA dioxygenase family protein [Candidatus Rokubacteria bacterium]